MQLQLVFRTNETWSVPLILLSTAWQGDCQWELSRGNISEAVIELKSDTPFPPTLLSYKAELSCGWTKLWEALCGLPQWMGSKQSVQKGSEQVMSA